MTQILFDPDRAARFLAEVGRRVIVYDGAMGTNIQRYNLSAADYGDREGCNEYLTVVKSEVIGEIHTGFLEAGCDVLETNSFGGSRLKLAEYGLAERTYEINYQSARLARRLADRFATPERPRWVAGSIGPTGMLPSSSDPTLGRVAFEELAAIFEEQAQALVEGGCDILLIETGQDILEVKAAIVGIGRLLRRTGLRVPIQAQVTLDTSGRMLLGTDVAAAMVTLEALPIDVLGLNCSTGPEHMREPVRYLGERSRLPISVIPNAGIPHNVDGRAEYPQTPGEMAAALREFVVDLGVSVVGGCCGSTHEHLRQVVAAVRDLPLRRAEVGQVPAAAGGIRAVALHQEPPPLLVGERVNAQGSRKVKRLLLAEDYDGVLGVAREQVEGGAHVLDVCVALTERSDEVEQMRHVVKKLATGVEAPLMIDSTEDAVIREALRAYPGRAIVNSINLENGRGRIDGVLPHVKEHGAAVVALTIDEQGMAKTAERKLEVARRIHEIAVGEYGLAPEDLIFDPLTFTLATGEPELANSAVETIEGIRRIEAELPGVLTNLGVSNVSFGLAPHARAVLNSVFLYHCVEAGLDLAIVNPTQITPYAEVPPAERELAEDLIHNRRPDALARYIAYFEENGAAAKPAAGPDPLETLSVEQAIHYQILHRKKDGIEARIDEVLKRRTPVDVLNEILLPAMKDVGDRFGAGELILPFVLQSAEVMKRAVAHLEQFLDKQEGYAKGKVVLATVYGDVHDIGKNLVSTILTNNGYTVYDLGKQVPINRIVDTAVEVGADAIGLSALLVSTSKQMPLCVKELAYRGLAFPVIVGGAAINPSFGRRILFLDDGSPYAPGVFYAKDAFAGLALMDQLTDPVRRAALVERTIAEAERDARAVPALESAQPAVPTRSDVRQDVPVPAPPFWGFRVLEQIPLDDVFACLDLNTLFRLHWGAKNASGEKWERLVDEEFRPRLEELKALARRDGFLQPSAVYGYFPCQSAGNDLIVYEPAGRQRRELARFQFPRQPGGERLCLADYFRSVDSGELDVVAFQVVTVGDRATALSEALQQQGDYSRSFFVHGLSVQAAEATAEFMHRHIAAELGLPAGRGKRYSWGYPACPDLADHEKLFRVLPVQQAIGVDLTPAYQFVPEQSTAALIVHHPEAKYYSTLKRAHYETRG